MGDIAGTTFAGYEVRDVIGTDLVSTLYRATEPDHERTMSLRVVAPDLCVVDGSDRELYRRFREQAIASLTFDHRRSLQVEEIGEYAGQAYLVAPFVDAVPLSQLVDGQTPMAVAAALHLAAQIADVLDAGHEAGLVHGAVNPSTLFVARPDGDEPPQDAYLVGYGVGALLALRLKRDRKQLTVVDDLLYVAPEQLRQQTTTDRSDQYALACALVHMLTGRPVFERESIGGLFGAHLFVDPELDAAAAWAEPLRKGMAKEPEDRYATCSDLIAAVSAEIAAAARGAAARGTDATPVPAAAGTPRRENADAASAIPAARAADAAPGRVTDAASARALAAPAAPAAPVDGSPARSDRGVRQHTPSDVADGGSARDGDVGGQQRDEHTRVSASGPADARNGDRPATPSWVDDDVPLLSEVLSQHTTRGGRQWTALWALVVLVVLALVVVAVRFVLL